jgi:hypothetical protein
MDNFKDLNRAKYRAFFWRKRFLADDTNAIALYKFQEAAAEIIALREEWRQVQKDTWRGAAVHKKQPQPQPQPDMFAIDFL